MTEDLTRRCDHDRHTEAEKAITAAIHSVEALPPDMRLTEAVVLLLKARDRVADFVDGKP
jgi:hypothetical protein